MTKIQKLTLTSSLPLEIVLTMNEALDIRNSLSLHMSEVCRKGKEYGDKYGKEHELFKFYIDKANRIEELFDLINDKLGIEMEEVQ